MRQRQFRIQRHRFACELLRDRIVSLPQQQPGREKMRRGRVGRHRIHQRRLLTRFLVFLSLDVRERQRVRGLHGRLRSPRLHLLQQRNRFRWASQRKQCQATKLHGFTVARILRDGRRQLLLRTLQFTPSIKLYAELMVCFLQRLRCLRSLPQQQPEHYRDHMVISPQSNRRDRSPACWLMLLLEIEPQCELDVAHCRHIS